MANRVSGIVSSVRKKKDTQNTRKEIKEIMNAIHLIIELNSKFDNDLKKDLSPIVKHLQNAIDDLNCCPDITVKDITDRLDDSTNIIIQDALSEEGVVYEGSLFNMRTFWNDRKVEFMAIHDNRTIKLDIE